MEDTYILEMSHIVKTFPGVRALGDGCLRLKKGETHALIGENGAGKSTLMKILLGDYPADSGEILYKGKRVAFSSPNQANHAGICMIPQEVNMVETMDAAENVWLHREKRFSTCGFINKKKDCWRHRSSFDRMHLNLDPKACGTVFLCPKADACHCQGGLSGFGGYHYGRAYQFFV